MFGHASNDDLFVLANSLGKIWRKGRRRWSTELRGLFAEILLHLREKLIPIAGLLAAEAIGQSRHDIRGLADLFKCLAIRNGKGTGTVLSLDSELAQATLDTDGGVFASVPSLRAVAAPFVPASCQNVDHVYSPGVWVPDGLGGLTQLLEQSAQINAATDDPVAQPPLLDTKSALVKKTRAPILPHG